MIRPWQFLRRVGEHLQPVAANAVLRWVAGLVLFLAVLIGLLVAVQIVPEWQVRRAGVRSAAVNPERGTTPSDVAALQNEVRRTFIQVVGGAFALFALYLTYRRVKVAEQGHITDRYTKAIEQLGALTAQNKPNVEVRLGAIYALERIAIDSRRDHWTIMEVLTAYVRQNAPAPVQDPTKKQNEMAVASGPTTEIQAILTVLGRRRRGRRREHEGQHLDLRGSDLRGANFRGAHVEGANFGGAHLEGADFRGVNAEGANFYDGRVEGAWFHWAHVEGARFDYAHLEGTFFYGARVERAIFVGTHVGGAKFHGTHVEGAVFDLAQMEGADFRGALGLAVEQFENVEGWERAHFDEAFLRELKSAWRRKNFSPEDAGRAGTEGDGGPG